MNEWRESAVGLGLVFGTAGGIIISLLVDFPFMYGIVIGSIIGYGVGLFISIRTMKS
ncbi:MULTISPECIES: hypothetical protein [unclassified Exiguobacterium]|uniref:hypothetical protein n=1 Tax=unclassified Exiguobacterium TaxID=2644629 RepID=UPI001BE55C8C|nr:MULTISPECIES: hypothetical protein [unclassified Exiguobacterium]